MTGQTASCGSILASSRSEQRVIAPAQFTFHFMTELIEAAARGKKILQHKKQKKVAWCPSYVWQPHTTHFHR